MRNLQKIIRWDYGFYAAQGTQDCLVCLTPQQIYLVGQIIEPLKWKNTRWVGDTSQVDLGDISANLEYRLSEAIMCDCITDLQTQIQNLQYQVSQIFESSVTQANTDNNIDIFFDTAKQNAAISSYDIGIVGNCNDDELWSGILEVVTKLAQLGEDMLDTLLAQAEIIERAAYWVAIVPLVGDIIGEAVINALLELENTVQAYDAYRTDAAIEDIACDIFCMVKAQCRLPTNREFMDYYLGLSPAGLQNLYELSWKAIFDTVFGTSFATNQLTFFAINVFVLATLWIDGEVLGRRGVRWLGIWFAAGASAPSSNWQLLCEDCSEFEIIATSDGWIGGQSTGVSYTSGQTVTIEYLSGQWSYGAGNFDANGNTALQDPSTLVANENIGGLCRYDGSAWQFVGNYEQFIASGNVADLKLSINDSQGNYFDNTGSVYVRVTVV